MVLSYCILPAAAAQRCFLVIAVARLFRGGVFFMVGKPFIRIRKCSSFHTEKASPLKRRATKSAQHLKNPG
jgi:hypothetical protein